MAEQDALLDTDVVGGESSRVLDARSSLRTAMGAFEMYMQQEGFAENTLKAFLSDLNILSQFVGVGTAIGDISTRACGA